jgi:hypothetical protein
MIQRGNGLRSAMSVFADAAVFCCLFAMSTISEP